MVRYQTHSGMNYLSKPNNHHMPTAIVWGRDFSSNLSLPQARSKFSQLPAIPWHQSGRAAYARLEPHWRILAWWQWHFFRSSDTADLSHVTVESRRASHTLEPWSSQDLRELWTRSECCSLMITKPFWPK